MKLEILIPHYKETENEVKPLLDSIALITKTTYIIHHITGIICYNITTKRR